MEGASGTLGSPRSCNASTLPKVGRLAGPLQRVYQHVASKLRGPEERLVARVLFAPRLRELDHERIGIRSAPPFSPAAGPSSRRHTTRSGKRRQEQVLPQLRCSRKHRASHCPGQSPKLAGRGNGRHRAGSTIDTVRYIRPCAGAENLGQRPSSVLVKYASITPPRTHTQVTDTSSCPSEGRGAHHLAVELGHALRIVGPQLRTGGPWLRRVLVGVASNAVRDTWAMCAMCCNDQSRPRCAHLTNLRHPKLLHHRHTSFGTHPHPQLLQSSKVIVGRPHAADTSPPFGQLWAILRTDCVRIRTAASRNTESQHRNHNISNTTQQMTRAEAALRKRHEGPNGLSNPPPMLYTQTMFVHAALEDAGYLCLASAAF